MTEPKVSQKNNTQTIVILLIIIVLVIFIILYLFLSKKGKVPQVTTEAQPTPIAEIGVQPLPEILAKVGEENIYKKTVTTGIPSFNEEDKKSREVVVNYLDQVIRQSIILQAAAKEGKVELTPDIYNSADLNLANRSAKVAEIEKLFNNQATKISGAIISIWYLNDIDNGLEYDVAQKMALDKITPIYNDAKAKKITALQAADRIRNDASIAKIDAAYIGNAYAKFEVNQGKTISMDKKFDEMIWATAAGEVTELYNAKSSSMEGAMPIAYVFAVVDSKQENQNLLNFNQWFENIQSSYEVQKY